MASVHSLVSSIARVSAYAPSLLSIVRPKRPVSTAPNRGFETLIEQEIIPRLVVAHGDDPVVLGATAHAPAISPEEVATFAPMALGHAASALLDHVETFVARGVPVDTIFVDLLAPAARHLGTMWEDDTADFVEVTMALWRLQEVVRELSARVPVQCDGGIARQVLCAVIPGEQHSFGAVMIEDMFRRAGWQTELVTECDKSKLLGLVAKKDFDLVCLTATSDCATAMITSLVKGLRSVTRNPDLNVMVGGRAFEGNVRRAKAVGADGTAATAAEALALAAELVEGRVVQRSVSA